jgi:hypothetical protein
MDNYGCKFVHLSAAQLQPIVDSIASRLPTWKAGLMSKPGRLAMVKSILSAIPIQQLLAYAPPKKTLKLIEKIKRGQWRALPRQLEARLPSYLLRGPRRTRH